MDFGPTLLGIAIDVSGSMTTSIRNQGALDLSRLAGVERGLDAIVEDSRRLAREHAGAADLQLHTLIYAFGLRAGAGFADVLSLLRATRDPDFERYVEQRVAEARARAGEEGRRMRREAQDRYGGIADIATGLGFGHVVRSVQREAEASARARLRRQAEAEVEADVTAYLREKVGDTTLTLAELAELWGGTRLSSADISRFIYGSTPLRACAEDLERRLERERASAGPNERQVLLIVSDGEPTDGDPRPAVARMRAAGVHVACAFITNADVHAPRHLLAEPDPGLTRGARLMFDLASEVDALVGPSVRLGASPWREALQRSDWTVPEGARLFVQVNHSEVLADFMRVIATAYPRETLLGALSDKFGG